MNSPSIRLTHRQRQIADLLALGLSNKEIGAELGLSPHTIDGALRVIYATFGVSSRVCAALAYCELRRNQAASSRNVGASTGARRHAVRSEP